MPMVTRRTMTSSVSGSPLLRFAARAAIGIAFFGIVGSASLAMAQSDGQATEASQKVKFFELRDWRGKTVSLRDFDDKPVVVLAVLGTECPLAKLYAPRLQELADAYAARGVAFIGIAPNTHDSITDLAAYARRHDLRFPLLKDVGNRLADELEAVRTPEVYVLDAKRVIRYRGRIDDQYGIDYARPRPRHTYLKDAIEALLANQPVPVPQTESVGCHIGRVRQVRSDADVTYYDDIGPILRRRCVDCHREGEIAPFPLTDPEEVAGWADMIREVVDQNRMPPWHADDTGLSFANDRRLRPEEKSLIRRWVAAGAPIGKPRPLPPLPPRPKGWNLPKAPDAVFAIAEEPVSVPAEGAVAYQYYRVPTGFTEEKWVSAIEVRPGNRAVVHHILVFVFDPADPKSQRIGIDGFLAAYVPGLRARPFPQGMARRIPPGAELVFQMHYTPIGTPQKDLSHIGLVFTDPATVRYELETHAVARTDFRIPPRAPDVRVDAVSPRIPAGIQFLAFNPHMHLRGRSFRYELELPDGKRRRLLNIPYYDFNWQTDYWLEKPLHVPRGSRLHVEAHFDNSADNPNNPAPEKWVRWGEQTWDEMMIGYVTLARPRRADQRRGVP